MVNSTITEHLEKLRYFVTIAEEKSINQAAKKLRMAQPTLSHSIRLLEEVIGVKLFQRASTGVSLTEAGASLYQFGKKLLLEAEQLEHSLHLTESNNKTTITVGTKEPYAITLWPRYVEEIKKILPHLDITLRISRTNQELLDLLRDEKIDLLLIPDPPTTQDVISFEVFKDQYRFYLSPNKLEEYQKKESAFPTFIFHRAACGKGKTIGNILKQEKVSLHNWQDVDSLSVAKSFAVNGLGVALLTESFAEPEVDEGKLIEVKKSEISCTAFEALKVCLCQLDKYASNKNLKNLRQAFKKTHLPTVH